MLRRSLARRTESLQARRGEVEPFFQLDSRQKRSPVVSYRGREPSRFLHEDRDVIKDTSHEVDIVLLLFSTREFYRLTFNDIYV